MSAIRVILADDHEIVRNGIKMLLESEPGMEVIAEASDGIEALEMCRQLKPDLLIVDIRMPEMNGIETVRNLSKNSPTTKALVLSMHDDEEYITQSIEVGASGYLLKDSSQSEFIKAIRTVYEGEKYFAGDVSTILVNSYLNLKKGLGTSPSLQTGDRQLYGLTRRERQILHLLYEGVGNKEIASKFNKSVRTIETHRFNIMKKLGVNNVTELLRKVEKEPALKEDIAAS